MTTTPPDDEDQAPNQPLANALRSHQSGNLWSHGILIATWLPESARWAVDWPAAARVSAPTPPTDRIALARSSGRTLTMQEVLTWADQLGRTRRREHSAYLYGRVRPDQNSGQWLAETGNGGTLNTLGTHPKPQPAEDAVRAALQQERDLLRQTLRASHNPDAAWLADAPWQNPDIQVWATQTQRRA
ncbi:hypothetical protein ACODT3_42655 [Streptomyces sp. 4.24]|uniref:hypothetical protein n=1 Tax=Streptomyces tritrimontium TaxID=3406573 RepID=UPI003BB4E7A8